MKPDKWDTMNVADRQAYRDGMIAMARFASFEYEGSRAIQISEARIWLDEAIEMINQELTIPGADGVSEESTCPSCNGSGLDWFDFPCRQCDGQGFVYDQRIIETGDAP